MRIQFKYKNHEGKIEDRDVDITHVEFVLNNNGYGYQPGWAISGWDYSRGRDGNDYRTFFLSHIVLPEIHKFPFGHRLMSFPRTQK